MKKLIDITTFAPPMTHQEKVEYLVDAVAKGDASFLQDEAYKKIIIDSLQGRAHRARGRTPKQGHVQKQRDYLVANIVVRFLCENKDMPLYRSKKEDARNKYDVIEREYIFEKVIALGWKDYGSVPSITRALKNVFSGNYLAMMTMMNFAYYYNYVAWPRGIYRLRVRPEGYCVRVKYPAHEITIEEIDLVNKEFEKFIKTKLGSFFPK